MSTTQESADSIEPEVRPNNLARKRKVLLLMAGVMLTVGIVNGLVDLDQGQELIGRLVTSVLFGALVVTWCILDSAERGSTLWRGFAFMAVVFPTWLVVVPIYLMRTRGWRRGFISVLLAVAFFVSLALAAALTMDLIRTARGLPPAP